MGVYTVTGSASGMGHAVAEKLRAAGHRVIGVDIKDADVVAVCQLPKVAQAPATRYPLPVLATWTERCWPLASARPAARLTRNGSWR
ncbi:3-alpha-hydroxysteroid dehydrogenase/carbonyl reductase [Mycobacterium simulans]|nr:3-alpha-hydroxysteroid dehydrogenase/carbonyl reductase [Mycobacterium simulans]